MFNAFARTQKFALSHFRDKLVNITSIPRMLEIFTMSIYFFTTKDVFKTSLRNFEFLSSLATKILQCSDFDSVFFLSFLYYRCSLVCFTSPVALYLASSLSVFWCHELMQR